MAGMKRRGPALIVFFAVSVSCWKIPVQPVIGIDKENCVVNHTYYKVNPIVLFVLGDIYGFRGLTVNIFFTARPLVTDGFPVDGFTVSYEFQPEVFSIFLARGLSREDWERTIIHELAHLKQYYAKELVMKDKNTAIYRGREINLQRMHQKEWPFENDARAESWRLGYLIRKNMRK